MTQKRFELLGTAIDYIEDAHRDFQSTFEACVDDIEMFGEAEMNDEILARMERAENALKSGLRFLEMFKKFA